MLTRAEADAQGSSPAGNAARDAAGPCGLAGIRVLDLGRYIAAPLCAAMLADQGAEVIRVEAPSGAPDRDVMPIGIKGRGALYLQMNRNKKSLTLDIERPEGRSALDRLVQNSDVVIINLPRKALQRAMLDYDSLAALRADIIVTTISALGLEGPDQDRIGFDGTGQALSGAMYLTGSGERPLRAAVSYVDYATAMAAAFATMAALYERKITGRGQHVQASLLGTALTMMNPMLIEEAVGARSRGPLSNRSPIAGPSDMFRTNDGWIMVQVIGDTMFRRWAGLVGRDDLIGDRRFATDIDRGENGELLSAIMAGWCASRSTAECLAALDAARLPGCRVLTPAEALSARENVSGGFFRSDPIGSNGPSAPIATRAIRTAASESLPGKPAPELGADTEALLAALGYSSADIEKLSSPILGHEEQP